MCLDALLVVREIWWGLRREEAKFRGLAIVHFGGVYSGVRFVSWTLVSFSVKRKIVPLREFIVFSVVCPNAVETTLLENISERPRQLGEMRERTAAVLRRCSIKISRNGIEIHLLKNSSEGPQQFRETLEYTLNPTCLNAALRCKGRSLGS